jgi:hypothetical protein
MLAWASILVFSSGLKQLLLSSHELGFCAVPTIWLAEIDPGKDEKLAI